MPSPQTDETATRESWKTLSIEQMSFLNTAIVSDQAIAGMLVISIPAIAAAIIKGGEVGMQALAGLVAPPRDPKDCQQPGHGQHADGQCLAEQCQPRHNKGSGRRHEIPA